ncbi:YycH family regulatory protein [Peribacillus glennii]|uniref:Regulatory protein YycH domain-containing protein n=1 Tax=Peribacillus glennii TaxID=2303991 RepID=A0A372LAR6_9BACI|nr:two-component system activity regulator YycH [Peribacillus glennii]RFU62486.1 hypothetical protein D0466_15130 [Peribacillus glennii]
MSFEGAKNIILTTLVAASALLTWNIWTYQPEFKKIDQSEFIRDDSQKQELSEVIKPDRVLFHTQGKHFQTHDEGEIIKIQTEIAKWTLFNFKDASHLAGNKKFLSFVHADGNTEVIFPDQIPLNLYKSVLNFDDRKLPKVSFDRIIFKTEPGISEGKVYFVNYKQKKVYQSQVSTAHLKNFNNAFASRAEGFPEYISKEINPQRTLFLPKEAVQLSQVKYYINYLDIDENFKETLFTNPDKVVQDSVTRGKEYTDGSKLLSEYQDFSTIEFVNPAQKSYSNGAPVDLLQKSIDFVSNHGGWGDHYDEGRKTDGQQTIGFRYSAQSEDGQKVIFRLFKGGYPVFNEQGMSEIEQTWGDEEIYRFRRPYFSIAFAIETDYPYKVKLPSGQQILQQFTENRNIELQDLEDIRVGYKLSRDPLEPKLIVLEPSWYYLYGGTWTVLPINKPVGGKIGLE